MIMLLLSILALVTTIGLFIHAIDTKNYPLMGILITALLVTSCAFPEI